MIGWIATRLGLDKYVVAGLVTAALLALAGLGAWGAVSGVRSYLASVAQDARDARDTHWRQQIAEANLAVQMARTEQALTVSRIESKAAEERTNLRVRVSELEKKNALLAGFNRGGFDLDRVRLLNAARAGQADRAR